MKHYIVSGSLVRLASGGPDMTVETVSGSDDIPCWVTCVWFECNNEGQYYGEPMKAEFWSNSLVLHEDQTGGGELFEA